jgi:diguanylate cyclase (GGDEF)-like protein
MTEGSHPRTTDETSGAAAVAAVADGERRARVDALNAEARSIRRFDYERLRRLAEDSFELACQTGADGEQYTAGMAEALGLLAYRAIMLGDGTAAQSLATQTLALLGSCPPSSVLGNVYETLGWTNYYLGDYVEALDYSTKALRIGERIGDRSLQAYALDRIACVHASAGHLDVALDAALRALAIHRELGDAMGEAIALNNIAYTYMDLGDFDSATEAAEASLRYCETQDRHHLQMGVLDTLAEIHLRMGDLSGAEGLSIRALTLAREHDSEPDEANSMMALGRIAYARGAWDEAHTATERALSVAEERGRAVEQYESHELLSRIDEKRGDPEGALAHFKRYHELKQEKINEETTTRLANLRVEHQVQTARKDAEIERLRGLALEREVEERRIAQARLEAQASLDPLTGLFNRRHLSVLADELAAALRRGHPASLMLFDIDAFKLVNDTHGHQAGDQVLIALAQQLQENSRDSDTPCRYGGDEFLVLLAGMDTSAARKAAERLRTAVSSAPIQIGAGSVPVTVSGGVATVYPGSSTTLAELIERADHALYAAKEGGRDRVVVAE